MKQTNTEEEDDDLKYLLSDFDVIIMAVDIARKTFITD